MKVKSESEVAQLCLALCDPMDCSQPGSSVHGIFILLLTVFKTKKVQGGFHNHSMLSFLHSMRGVDNETVLYFQRQTSYMLSGSGKDAVKTSSMPICPALETTDVLLLIVMKSPQCSRHCIEQASSLWFQTLPNHIKSQTQAILSVP